MGISMSCPLCGETRPSEPKTMSLSCEEWCYVKLMGHIMGLER